MKIAPIRQVAVLVAGVLFASPVAWSGSAMEVFKKAGPSIVVVLALDKNGSDISQGSGVVVGSNEVVTNCHVVEKATGIVVRQASGQTGGRTWRMTASLLARHDKRDLCLLLVDELSEPPAAPVIRVGSAKRLSVGEEVYAIGAPAGLELSLSRGIVSQLRGVFGKRRAPVVQTDAAISRGSSGGGLFDRDGNLVGITTFKWRGENLNFALPAEWVQELQAQGSWKLAAAKLRSACLEKPNFGCLITLARGAAYDISGSDCDYSRIHALSAIATVQAQAGDKHLARQALTQTEAECSSAALETGFGILDTLQDTDALTDLLEDTEALLRGLALQVLATAQAEAGVVERALEIAYSIENATTREWALSDIAAAQAQAGDSNGAFETANRIGDSAQRAWALSDIAVAQIEAGERETATKTLTAAIEAAGSIGDASQRATSLSRIAMAQADAAGRETATKTLIAAIEAARSIGEASQRSEALSKIVAGQARTGDLPAALKTVSGIRDPASLASALRNIAMVLARAGRTPVARQTFAATLKVTKSIADSYERARALYQIAVAQKEVGEGQTAERTLAAALQTARGVSDSGRRAAVLAMISGEQANTGHILAAFATASRIEPARRGWALARIASAQAEQRDFKSAIKTAMSIETASERAHALADVAVRMTKQYGAVLVVKSRPDDRALSLSWSADIHTAYEDYLLSLLGERDTAKTGLSAVGVDVRLEASLGLQRWERVLVQRALAALNMDVGPADGIFGPRTRRALRFWQAAKGVDETGYLTRQQADMLIAAGRLRGRLLEFCKKVPHSALCSDVTSDDRARLPEGGRMEGHGAEDRTEHERLLEFCREVPQSALCGDVTSDDRAQLPGGSRIERHSAEDRRERERLLEFCAEVPHSALCRGP